MNTVHKLFDAPNSADYGLPWVVIGRDIQSCVAVLSPDLAKELMGHNDGNRRITGQSIQKYRSDIEQDRWRLNGEAIIITHDGRLLSGQHRCLAVIQAGAPIVTVFTRVPSEDVMTTLDQGKSRTIAHALGFSDAETKHAPTLRLLHDHLMGISMSSSRSAPLSGPAAVELVQALPDVAASVRVGDGIYREISGSKACYAAFHYLASKTGHDHDEFFARLKDSAGLGPKSPILHARNRINRERRSSAEVMRALVIWPLLVKAWNAWVAGREVGVLRFGPAEMVEPIAGLPTEWQHGAWKA